MERRRRRWHPPTDDGALPPSLLLNLQVDASSSTRNPTTASCKSSGGDDVEVTLFAAIPPRVSHLQVCSSTASAPYIIAAEDDLVLLGVAFGPGSASCYDYFVYTLGLGAGQGSPSLELLPDPGLSLDDSHVGVLRRGGGYHLAALCYTPSPGTYDLRLYSSATGEWTTKQASLDRADLCSHHVNRKVIAVGGDAGTMGWVDLWRGVLLCDVLRDDPRLRYVPLPPPLLPTRELEGCPRNARDIAVIGDDDRISYVELQIRVLPGSSSTGSYISGGWTVAVSTIDATNPDCWRQEYKLYASQVAVEPDRVANFELLPKLSQDDEAASHGVDRPILVRLHTGHPTLCLHDERVVYLMTKVDYQDERAWVLAIDMESKKLQGVAEFTADRVPGFCFTYTHSRVSEYMNVQI